MITSTNLVKLHNDEYYQLMSDMNDHCKTIDKETSKLAGAIGKFDTRFQSFDKAFKQARKTGLVDTKQELDAGRDDLTKGFYNTVLELLRFPNDEINAAAQRMIDAFDRYGGNQIAYLNEDAETAAITNSLQDISQEDIATTKTQMWHDELTKLNAMFAKTQQKHTQKQSEYIAGLLADERKRMDEEFRTLCKTIDALALIEGEDAYKPTADYINQLVANAQATVKQRASAKRTRDEKKEAEQ